MENHPAVERRGSLAAGSARLDTGQRRRPLDHVTQAHLGFANKARNANSVWRCATSVGAPGL
jgi:hypothetical protein